MVDSTWPARQSENNQEIAVRLLELGKRAGVKEVFAATATLDFPSMTLGAHESLTITVAGAAVGDTVYLGPPSGIEAGLIWEGYVSAANTVTVRLYNATAGTIDPASATWRATVVHF